MVTSMQVSLSSAQRRLAAFPPLARRGAKKAKAQEIADVTSGQSKLAFSESVTNKIYQGVVNPTFEGDLKKTDTLLKAFIGKGRYKLDSETSINDFSKTLKVF